MDAFEEIVSQLLEEDGFWVQKSVKVNLTKDEKVKISKPTTPRPEIDLIAYNFKDNILYLLEVKSYFDSYGVKLIDLQRSSEIQIGRYKLFTSKNYRSIITNRLKKDLINKGLINRATKISYGLIAGNVYQEKESEFKIYFKKNKWLFLGPSDIKEKVISLSKKGYENNPVTIVSKILLRK